MTPLSAHARMALLLEVLPQLPLFARYRFHGRGSSETAVPLVCGISNGNPDDAHSLAARLGCPSAFIHQQLEKDASFDRDVATDSLPAAQVLTFEDFAAAMGDPSSEPRLWWHLSLPIVDPAQRQAILVAQLGWQCGAEDFQSVLTRHGTGWRAGPFTPYP